MLSPTPQVAICILTFKRPEMLAVLLESLTRLSYPAGLAPVVRVFVIDNDAAASSRETCECLKQQTGLDLTYLVEPEQGIPLARNTGLEAALPGADYVCFLDDDEWVEPEWLAELLRVQSETQADCIWGPVISCYDNEPEPWVKRSRLYDRERWADGTRIYRAATNNLLLRADFLRQTGLRFDPRLRFSGGSDHLFVMQGQQLGMKIFWADKAVVSETVPLSRQSFKWIIKRNFRLGNTLAICDRLLGGTRRVLRRAAIGCGRIGLGVPLLIISLFRGRHAQIRALAYIVRGAGILSGLYGYTFHEYAPGRVQSDRAQPANGG